MRIEYDRISDALYIYLVASIPSGGVAKTLVDVGGSDTAGFINFDLDTDRRLLGIEILNASEMLPAEVLDSVERIGLD